MTWLGKIFTVLVLVLAVANAWFITTVWVTRNNWKVQRDAYEKAYQDANAARKAEYAAYQTDLEAKNGQLVTLQSQVASALKAKEEAEQENRTNRATFATTMLKQAELSKNFTDLQTKIEGGQAQNQEALNRTVKQEDELAKQAVAINTSDRERIAAESARRRAEGIADMLARQTEDLRNIVAELRQSGGNPGQAVLGRVGGLTPAVPEHLRGTVTHVQDKDPQTNLPGELIQISLGLDAGLSRGAVLVVSRETNGGTYIGTLVIDTVYPKYAVGVFRPASGKPFNRLKPDEFPKVGDTVRVNDRSAPTAIGPR